MCILGNWSENFRKGRHTYFFFNYFFFLKKYKLKAKSNFTLLLYIPFLGIGEWYFKCLIYIKLQSIIHMTAEFHVFTVINATNVPQ